MKLHKFLIPLTVMAMTITGCTGKTTDDGKIKVTGVELDKETATLDIYESLTLNATVNPDNATDKTVTWTSSDETVATVKNGVVSTLNKYGTSTITVTTNDGGFKDTCVITVEDLRQEVAVTITNNVVDYATLSTNKATAKGGDEITVSIALTGNGYTLVNFKLVDSNDSALHLDDVTETSFKYHLPTDGIAKFSADMVVKEMKLYIHDDKELIDQSVMVGKAAEGPFEELDASKIGTEDGVKYFAYPYGSYARFLLKSDEHVKATGVTIDGVKNYATDGNGYVTFPVTLDTYDEDEFFLDVKVTYEDDSPITGQYEFNVVTTSHLTVELFSEDKSRTVESADMNTIVLIKVTAESEDYGVREIKVTAPTSDVGAASETSVSNLGDGWYSFKTPYSYSGQVKITVTEANYAAFKDCDAVGSYLGIMLSNSPTSHTAFGSQTISFSNDGVLVYGGKSDVITSFDATDGILKTKYNNTLRYGHNALLFGIDNDTHYTDAFSQSYDILAIKKADADDATSLYGIQGETFLIDGYRYVTLIVTRDGQEHASVFVDYKQKAIYYDVDYKMIIGDKINDAICVYEIRDRGNVIKAVGSNGSGTYAARTFLEGFYGIYTCGEQTLTIVNGAKANYDGDEYPYTIEGNQVILENASYYCVLEIDNENKTFKVIDEHEKTFNLPEFAGKFFRSGDYVWEDSVTYYCFCIEFSATDMKLSCLCDRQYHATMTNHSSNYKFINNDVDYTYDENTKTITVTMEICSKKIATVNLKYVNGNIEVYSKDVGFTCEGYGGSNVKAVCSVVDD